MRKRNKNLTISWSVFAICVAAFLIGTKFCYNSQKKQELSYRYRIIVDESIKEFAKSERELEKKIASTKNIAESKKNVDKNTNIDQKKSIDEKLYEKCAYGYIPKISPDGVRVFDAYSAKYKSENKKNLGFVILLDVDTDRTYLLKIINRLGKSKATFVIPHYSNHLSEIANIITESGNEFFLQIPTQTSVSGNKRSVVYPFLANMSLENLADKLCELLASTKHAIGLANISSTLLTKSIKDMSYIADELSRRGLAFLNLENPNEVIQKILEGNSELIYISAPNIFHKGMEEMSLQNKNIISVFINDVPNFLDEISKQKDCSLAPVSAIIKR